MQEELTAVPQEGLLTEVPGFVSEERMTKQIERPRKQEMLQNHEVNIRFLSVGCVVRVGCKEIAFTTVREAMTAINDYVKNPHGESERWWKIFSEQE